MPMVNAMRRYSEKRAFCSFLSCFLSLAAVTLFIFSPHDAHSAQATLSWVAPATNTDGTPLTDLAGYKIYYGTVSSSYSQVIDVGSATTSTVSNLNDGATYYLAVTAYDSLGLESGYSNEVSKTIQAAQQYSLSIIKNGTGTGTITSSPAGVNCGATCTATYNPGSVVTLTAAPASGSTFGGWSGGGCAGTGTCSLSMNVNMTVTAVFGINALTITATAGSGGTISPPGSVSVNQGATQAFTITPNSGYTVSNVLVDGVSVGAVSSYTFTNVTANHTITASFGINSYTITASAGAGGSISPSGSVAVSSGTNKAFTITPNSGYTVSDVQVDGASVGVVSSYAFSSVSSSHTISATFNPVQVCGGQLVKNGSSYYSSVQAAYNVAHSGASIQIIGTSLSETPTLNRNIVLTLQGGYDCGFASDSLYSIIDGALIISSGSATLDNIIIQ